MVIPVELRVPDSWPSVVQAHGLHRLFDRGCFAIGASAALSDRGQSTRVRVAPPRKVAPIETWPPTGSVARRAKDEQNGDRLGRTFGPVAQPAGTRTSSGSDPSLESAIREVPA